MTGLAGAIAGDMVRAGFATAMMLPPLDAITCTKSIYGIMAYQACDITKQTVLQSHNTHEGYFMITWTWPLHYVHSLQELPLFLLGRLKQQ
jgi:hypothetical protein